jgi:hypothetical protein
MSYSIIPVSKSKPSFAKKTLITGIIIIILAETLLDPCILNYKPDISFQHTTGPLRALNFAAQETPIHTADTDPRDSNAGEVA